METEDSRWRSLYKIGGISAMLAAVLLLIEIIVFTIWPQPGSVIEYFALFQSNILIGLIDYYLLEIFAYILFVPVFLALYVAIRRLNESHMIIAIFLAILGVAIFLATNNTFTLLSLSNQYITATTEAQKAILLAAGHAIISNTGQRAVGGFNMGFFLVSVAGLIASTVMLRSRIFSKTTAYVGILAFGISLADYFRIIFLPSSIILLLLIAMISGILLLIWLILVGQRLLHLGGNFSL